MPDQDDELTLPIFSDDEAQAAHAADRLDVRVIIPPASHPMIIASGPCS
jgi:hypothetical protein